MFLHILVTYTLNQQILGRAIHLLWDTKLANTIKPSEPNFWKGQIQWAVITTGLMFMCWFISNLIVCVARATVRLRVEYQLNSCNQVRRERAE